MKIRQEKHIYLHTSDTLLKTKEDCIDESYYKCAASKIIHNNFEGLNCTKNCLPKSLFSSNSNKTFICENEEQEICSLSYFYNTWFYNPKILKCPKSCSVVKYSGKLDYWEPDWTENPANFILYIRFSPPVKATVYEEYLIYDFFGMVGTVGGALGIFIGFSCISVWNVLADLKKQQFQNMRIAYYKFCQSCNK